MGQHADDAALLRLLLDDYYPRRPGAPIAASPLKPAAFLTPLMHDRAVYKYLYTRFDFARARGDFCHCDALRASKPLLSTSAARLP